MEGIIETKKYMTLKEIADIVGCNEITVRRKIKQLFPNLLINGKTTKIEEDEAKVIVGELKAKVNKQITLTQHRQNAEVPRQNVEVIKSIVSDIVKDIITPIIQQQQETNKLLISMFQSISKPVNQIEIKQDYYSILGFFLR